jgi:hypothetical protein
VSEKLRNAPISMHVNFVLIIIIMLRAIYSYQNEGSRFVYL